MANKNIKGTSSPITTASTTAATNNQANHRASKAQPKAPKKAVTTPTYRDIIPRQFFKDDKHPHAETVGELIAVLQQLPAELYIGPERQGGVHVIVYNIRRSDIHVGIEEGDGL